MKGFHGPMPLTVARRAVGDRKSTRLNSSHLGISYAVFCLKKKNILEIDLASRIAQDLPWLYQRTGVWTRRPLYATLAAVQQLHALPQHPDHHSDVRPDSR